MPANTAFDMTHEGLMERFAQAFDWAAASTHNVNVQAGWWNDPQTGEDLKSNSLFPYVVATKLLLSISELVEGMEGYRCELPDDKLPEFSMMEVEVADCIIRLLDLSGAMKLRVGAALVAKMEYNAQRADHKPENRVKKGGKKF